MPATAQQTSTAPIYDGHAQLVGQFGGAPQSVPPNMAHTAINRFMREDRNATRPRIQSLNSHFDTEADRIWFEGANGQGVFFRNAYPSNNNASIMVSIAGKIFSGVVIGRDIYWSVVFDGNSRFMCNAWFVQGFEWVVVQDGIHEPIFWNGTDPARRSDPTKGEMPVGSVMAYIHGRFALASADGKNTVQVGDIVYGNNVTNHNDILLFTDQEYWAEGGSFDIAANLGDIMGLYPMPWLDTGTGANELVALCTQGFTSFDLSQDRTTWLDQQVQKISMIGQGCVSSIGFAGLNADLFYRRTDGVGSYRNARTVFSVNRAATPVSREVNNWLRTDRNDLLKFVPMVSWQNMVITGISPQIAAPINPCAGWNRYCRGMVIFDAQTSSTTSREGAAVWHGAWTGIRPWGFAQGLINGADRCFALSYDRDGKNRIYEFTLQDGNDLFGGEQRKQYWRYDTAALGQVEARCSYFDLKKVTGGQIVLSDIIGSGDFNVQVRPDGAPCLVPMSGGEIGCDCPTYTENCVRGTHAQWANLYLQNPPVDGDNSCVPGSIQPGGMFHYLQARVSGHGSATIERLRLRMAIREAGETAECIAGNCEPVTCCMNKADFAYHIAPAGTNTEVPDVPCPVPPVVTYTSTRYFTAFCATLPGVYATGMGQATSSVSQADADAKALAAAQANAQAQLTPAVCPSCTPSVLSANNVDGGDVDFSEFFASDAYDIAINQPWRLVDAVTGALIATGHVDATGTLVTDQSDYGYAHGTFDPVTNIYTDNGGGQTTINLQLGCSINGQPTWPDPAAYGE